MSTFTITVPGPCQEDWEQMQPDGYGRFCAACSKTVIDFTTFSDEAFIQYFGAYRTGICGRFSPHQLSLQIPLPNQPDKLWPVPYVLPMALRYALLSLLPLSLQATPVAAQQVQQQVAKPSAVPSGYPVTVEGRVTDGQGQALAGVRVQVSGTDRATLASADGRFCIQVDKESVLVFSATGKASQQRNVTSTNKMLSVQLYPVRSVNLQEVSIKDMPQSDRWIMGGAVSLVSSEAIAIRGVDARNPLVILDGRPFAGGTAALDPSSTRIVRKLPIPEGMTLYGVAAVHGVLIAETRKPSVWKRLSGFLRKKQR